MNAKLRTLFACCAAGALAVSLAACQSETEPSAMQLSAAEGETVPGWSMMDLAGVDPEFFGDEGAALPKALPMQASYAPERAAGYAPSYDYAPDDDGYYEPLDESYYDDGYYADDYYDEGYYDDAGYYDDGYYEGEGPYPYGYYDVDDDRGDYALLALAVTLAAMLGDAPPDYGFYYDDVSPWAWRTGDGYYRYAEPIHGGYRYYYYQPGAHRPFFVCDPYYSYGYRGDRLVAIYDHGGRRVDPRRAHLQLNAAKAYYARAEHLYRAGQSGHYGVSAPRWERERDSIARERNAWFAAQSQRPEWRSWEARNAPRLQRQWSNEALVRREAETGFAQWKKAEYRTPAPAFYTPQVRAAQVRRVSDLRRDHAAEIAERRRERTEQRVEQQREARQIAARVERTVPAAERRSNPAESRERIIERPVRAAAAADRPRAERVAAVREAPRAAARVERAAPQRQAPRPQAVRQAAAPKPAPRQAAAPKPAPRQAAVQPTRTQPAPRVAERRDPQPRAQQVQREQPKAAPAPRPAREEPVRREAAAPRPAPEPRAAVPRPAPEPRVERQQPRPQPERAAPRSEPAPRQQPERAAPQPRPPRPEPAAQPKPQAREERQEAREERRAEREQRRNGN